MNEDKALMETGSKYSHRARDLGGHFCTGKRNGVRRVDKLRSSALLHSCMK